MNLAHLAPSETAPELCSVHEPCYSRSAAAEAYDSELGVYPGSPVVGGTTDLVYRLDLLGEHCVKASSIGRGSVPPIVAIGARDTEKSVHHRVKVASLLRLDEPEGAHRIPSSFAKKALVLFSRFLFVAKDPVFPPEPSEFLTLFGAVPLPLTAINLCLFDPVAWGLVGDAKLVGELTDKLLRKGADQLNGLGLKLLWVTHLSSWACGLPCRSLCLHTLWCHHSGSS